MCAIRENGAASGAGVLASYAWDALSWRGSITRGNGTVTIFGYDNASRLTGLTQNLAGAGDDQTFGFGFTAASQVMSRSAANDNYNWTAASASRGYVRNGLNQYTGVPGTAFRRPRRTPRIAGDAPRGRQARLRGALWAPAEALELALTDRYSLDCTHHHRAYRCTQTLCAAPATSIV